MESKNIKFSLLMAVYAKDDPRYLKDALNSVVDNSALPNETVIVIDGQIGNELKNIIDEFIVPLSIRKIQLPENGGLGMALRIGLESCSCEWVARFDSDDICFPDRFEKQLNFIRDHPEVDLFSAPILEFDNDISNEHFYLRDVPRSPMHIRQYSNWRSPMNHMAVMMRKQVAINAGNYQDNKSFEDYSLWVRMLLNGATLSNMNQPLVYARAGQAIRLRRGGLAYLKSEFRFMKLLNQWGFISNRQFYLMLIAKTPVRIMPAVVRQILYWKYMRKRISAGA